MNRTRCRRAWPILTFAITAFSWAGCTATPRENLAEDCGNQVDDDGNGAIDCQDAACAGVPLCKPEICDNNLDDDGDGRFDCADSACAALSVCGGGTTCGNQAVDPGEECDGADLGGRTCITQGFKAGALACAGSCTIDTSHCSNDGLEGCNNDVDDDGDGHIDCDDSECSNSFVCQCGNGTIDFGDEDCDGSMLPPETSCSTLGFGGGVLVCSYCNFDYSGCKPIVCGDGVVSAGEACDDGNTVSGDGCDADCQVELAPLCAAAATPIVAGTNHGNTAGAIQGFGGSCVGGDAKIYTYTPASTGTVTIVLNGTFGLGLHVRSTCADPATELACSIAPTRTTNPVVNIEVHQGVPITVFVVDPLGSSGPFTLTLVQTP